MATTTNYGWTTPDDTALVKDGASAIRSLGTSVDTTTKNLNPSTTLGDIEYRSSTSNTNTRVAIGSSGQALTVVAGVPSWAASPTSVLTTTGDTLYASAANTLARLGIGSTSQVLTVAGGVPTWATPSSGGMTLLNSPSGTTMSGSSTSISITPTGYTSLKIYLKGVYGSANDGIQLRLNGDTGSNYSYATLRSGPSGVANASGTSYFYVTQGSVTSNSDAKQLSFAELDIFNPTDTDFVQISGTSMCGPSGDMRFTTGHGMYDCSAAITTINFIATSGTFSGGTAFVYGVK
jgi:hypothetical protein